MKLFTADHARTNQRVCAHAYKYVSACLCHCQDEEKWVFTTWSTPTEPEIGDDGRGFTTLAIKCLSMWIPKTKKRLVYFINPDQTNLVAMYCYLIACHSNNVSWISIFNVNEPIIIRCFYLLSIKCQTSTDNQKHTVWFKGSYWKETSSTLYHQKDYLKSAKIYTKVSRLTSMSIKFRDTLHILNDTCGFYFGENLLYKNHNFYLQDIHTWHAILWVFNAVWYKLDGMKWRCWGGEQLCYLFAYMISRVGTNIKYFKGLKSCQLKSEKPKTLEKKTCFQNCANAHP